MRTWLLFAVMQTVIVGGWLVWHIEFLEPMAIAAGEKPIGHHIPLMLGTLFALGATYAITDISDWLARRRAARRDRDRDLKRLPVGRLGRVESSHTRAERRRLR
jgi:hypothetical protein